MNIYTEANLKKLAINCFLNSKEKDQLLKIYNNSDSHIRDRIVEELALESEIRSIEIRNRIRNRIRNS
jgi:hypothetical protein